MFSSLSYWFKTWISGKPHFIIGGEGNPYMLRWWIIPRNPIFNIYLHKIVRSDDLRALHDHPFSFISIMVYGSYDEVTDEGTFHREAPSIAYRYATHLHRLVVDKPCWTIVLTGPRWREWGFACSKGWIPWFEFSKTTEGGSEVGKGCGD